MRGDVAITYVGLLLGHGGDAIQMLQVADGVSRAGMRTRIVVPEVEESVTFARRAAAAGVECERTPLLAAGMGGPPQHFRSLLRLFRSIDSGIVHVHTGNSCLPRSLMATFEVLRRRHTVATLHSAYETIAPRSWRARLWAIEANRCLDRVISPSVHGARFQAWLGVDERRVLTISNAFDSGAAHGAGCRPRAELGVGPDAPLIVFTSRLDRQKRPIDAVRMFAEIRSSHPDARLVFVGDGAMRAAVEAEVRRQHLTDRVVLTGYRTDVHDWLAAATVWLLPTERENFSVAVLEAMAARCAVLSTETVGNDEVLVNDVNALTFPVGDVAAGAVALGRLLGDADLRARLGGQAATDVLQYTIERSVERHLAVYARAPRAGTRDRRSRRSSRLPIRPVP